MPEDQDVTQAGSSPAEGTAPNAETAPVSGEPQASDRPVQNIVAEFNRKFEKQQKQIETLMQYLVSQAQPQATAQPQPAGQPGQLTDDQLWRMAQEGDQGAFREYQRRIAAQEFQQRSQVEARERGIQKELSDLVERYPVLRDGNHPLTQHAHQIYNQFVRAGSPAGNATLLASALKAITERPDVVSEIYNQGGTAREQARQTATSRAQAGVTGATHRQDTPQQQQPQKRLSPQEADLARRMGIKDPAKAKERFMKRQETGQSSLGSVAAFVREDEF